MTRWIVAAIIACSIAAAAALSVADRRLDEPLALQASGQEPSELVFDVPPGSSLGFIANRLATDGVLRAPRLFALYGQITGKAESIQAGEYVLSPGVTPRDLLELLVAGKVRLHSLTVIEGWTVRELLAAIRANPALNATLQATNANELARELALSYEHAEGLFFPDTYRFAKGTTDADFLRRAHAAMRSAIDEVWAARASSLPFDSPYEALILASIIERETGVGSERRQISGVFTRRLQQGWRLETDPTVIYGLGDEFDGNLRRRDLDRDTPYNTYTRTGLPPTPIALPGRESLEAAVDPAPGDAMFFVASGESDGGHVFSATLAEHNRAVQRYLAALRSNSSNK